MEDTQSSVPVIYGRKEYTETVLNTREEADCKDSRTENPNMVYVSSLDEEDPVKETWPLSCKEIDISKTEPCATLFEKYVSKTVLSVGLLGVRPHLQSMCTFLIENREFIHSVPQSTLVYNSVFSESNLNTEVNLEIGSSDFELERALELALLDMCVGERSEVTLSVSSRTHKERDQNIIPVPCLKCVINLKNVRSNVHMPLPVKHSYLLSLLDANKELKLSAALEEKARGVALFKENRFVDAFHRFALGVKIIMTFDCVLLESDDSNTVLDEVPNQDVLSLYSTLCSNMAECQLKENNPSHAIILCKRALALNPSDLKALFRQASAAWALGDVDQAEALLKQLFELDPNNNAAKRLYAEVQTKLKKYEDEYTIMMKRIFHK